jgi:uncharacterized protein (DUF362 family)/Pyruvate/2-oxoacid:ferredoxin oxidoreductase delta subunit
MQIDEKIRCDKGQNQASIFRKLHFGVHHIFYHIEFIQQLNRTAMMAKVVLIKCKTYDYSAVLDAVNRGLKFLGGVDRFAAKNENILLKPNLLAPNLPENCVTTHPSVFRAVSECFLSTGAKLSYGDSPATRSLSKTASKAGLTDIATHLGLTLADFSTGSEIFYKEGRQNKKFTIAKGVIECDGLISLPKFKTHALTRITGCVKNQFGCIPGKLKSEFHLKLQNVDEFSRMLVDLNNYIQPRLYIVDGIQAMEGNGPSGGTPKWMNFLAFSDDPIALDAMLCRLVGLKPELVPTIIIGHEFGAGEYIENNVELLGDDFDQIIDRSFLVDKSPNVKLQTTGLLGLLNNQFFSDHLVSKPIIDQAKCNSCGTCINVCPTATKSIAFHKSGQDRPPAYNYDECIRCYCCQELCPEGAINLKIPLLRKFLTWI